MSELPIFIAAFVVALGILITVHEYGHFWVARKLGVRVLRFSIGFGRALWSRRFGADNTELVVAALPLGGYVKMLDEREAPVADDELDRAFNRKPLGVRTAVVAAGPIANFLFAIAAFWMLFMIGDYGVKPTVGDVAENSLAAQAGFRTGEVIVAVDNTRVQTWEDVVKNILEAPVSATEIRFELDDGSGLPIERSMNVTTLRESLHQGKILKALGLSRYREALAPILGDLQADGPAFDQGLQSGDRIVAIDGDQVGTWADFRDRVRESPQQPLQLEVERKGLSQLLQITPGQVMDGDQAVGRIGAGPYVPDDYMSDQRVELQYGPLEALYRAVVRTWDTSILMLDMLWQMLVGILPLDNISGPVSIAEFAGKSAQIGALAFLKFLALVSVSLAVLNLLPIPVLDGGHLFFYLVEFIRGEPLSEAAQAAGQRVGLILLLMLMTVAFYQDIVRLL